MKNQGLTIIELMITVIIIGIIAGIFTDIFSNIFDLYDSAVKDNIRYGSVQHIVNQIQDEIRHSEEIQSTAPVNLILSTYDGSDTEFSTPKKIIYNFKNERLQKYYEPANDTSTFNYKLKICRFEVDDYRESSVLIIINDYSDTYRIRCSKRNKK
ncbi:MAG TPA: prepilin-type N-terminal cleavage/methylation domain-containing protein [bacterium]|nr:prepilin-type N-terminal cleavage/methylation domain-containing protein [bacterium]